MSAMPALSDLKLMLSKGYALGPYTPRATAHPYVGQDAAAVRNWFVGESTFPSFVTTSTDGSTTTTSRTINIGSPADRDLSLIVHRCAASSTITSPTGWTDLDNRITVNGTDGLATFYKICDGTEGATATVTHGTSVRSITQAFVIKGGGTPAYGPFWWDIPLVGSVSPRTDPFTGGFHPGTRNLFLAFCTKPDDGEAVGFVQGDATWLDGTSVVNTGAGGSGASRIIYSYKWAVANYLPAVTFSMADVGAGGTNSYNFGIVVPPL
jgi:hypothetical protein